MHITATTAYPLPYSKVCDAVRSRVGNTSATRADLGGKSLIDFLVPRAMLNSLVREHRTEGRPRSIQNRFGQLGPGQSRGVNVAHRDVVKLSHDAARELVQKITSRVTDLEVDFRCKQFLSGALRAPQPLLKAPIPTGADDALTCRKHGEVFQPQVDTDSPQGRSHRRVRDLNHHVQEPVASSITTEVCSISNLARGQRARMEYTEGVTRKTKRVAMAPEVAPFKRNPSQRLLSAISQIRLSVLPPGSRISLTDLVDGSGVQSKFLRGSRGQNVQIKSARPTLIPLQRVFLRVVAIVPDVVDRAALPVEQADGRFDSIAISQQHCISVQHMCTDIQTQDACRESLAALAMNA